MPKISVIVPVYKVEDFLHRCVQSILSQTHKDLEVILVDDGSPDGCPAICDAYAEKDPRVKVIHKQNGGLSDARNAGLDIATGEYIGFVDSDDLIEPDMYAVLLAALEQQGADMAICNYVPVDEQNNTGPQALAGLPLGEGVLSRDQLLEKLGRESLMHAGYVTAWSKLYKRSLFEGLRFPKGRVHEDEFTVHHIAARCSRIATVASPLYRYVQRAGSIMNNGVTVKKLDAVYALHDRYKFFVREGMKKTARPLIVSVGWRLGKLMEQLPREAKKEVGSAVRLLLPPLLRRRPQSALRLVWQWLRYRFR